MSSATPARHFAPHTLVLLASLSGCAVMSCAGESAEETTAEDAGVVPDAHAATAEDVVCLNELRTFMNALYPSKHCETASDCKFVGTANIAVISEHCAPGFYVNKDANMGALLLHAKAYSECKDDTPSGCFSTPPEAMCAAGRCYPPANGNVAACLAQAPDDSLCSHCLCGACAGLAPCFGDAECMTAYACAVDKKCFGSFDCALTTPDNPCSSVLQTLGETSRNKFLALAYCATERGCGGLCLPE